MPVRTPHRLEDRILIAVFVCALLTHVWLVTRNWSVGFMLLHEFRQTQTALISHFIDREDNFSLLYEVPIVGKPWISVLLEVPFYEWSVVLVQRWTGWPLVVAARSVSLVCFYLTLPALWWLLGRLGLTRPRRLLALGLVLVSPVYIFYTRAVLMESMVLMCCAWFLVGYLAMMEHRRWTWFLLATVAGAGAALIKSATFAVWLIPAAAYSAWQLWRDLRAWKSWSAPLLTVFWGIAGVIVPLGLLSLWIRLTDPIKATHASAWIFTSANLSLDNWGLNNIAARFSAATWSTLLVRWSEALMPPWLVGVTLLAGLAAFPAQRVRVAGVGAVFFLAQLLFPFAYVYQDYYFYACGVFLLLAMGFILDGLLDSRLPRWLCGLLAAVLFLVPLHTYWRGYWKAQEVVSEGGFPYTTALRELTPKNSVIIVCGGDWAAIVPYYSQRRALLIRNGLVADQAYLARAFAELGDEDVAALVLLHDQRGNRLVRDMAVAKFDLEPEPTFSHPTADIYCSWRDSNRIRDGIKARGNYGPLTMLNARAKPREQNGLMWVTPTMARMELSQVTPVPLRVRFGFGYETFGYGDKTVLNAHPDSDLWLRAPRDATRIEWNFGMISSAWEKSGDKTDGVEMQVLGLQPGGPPRVIYHRVLDPVSRPEDRGDQTAIIPYQAVPGEFLQFLTRPRGSKSYDWTYWGRIEVK